MTSKLKIFNTNNESVGDVALPELFEEPYRPDLISRVVLAIEANMRQPYGAYPEAGRNSSSKLSRRRRDYKGSYGHGISRVPRKIISRNGTSMNWVGALAPGTVKGRRAHPPKTSKIWNLKVQSQEKKKATKSALAASLNRELVIKRGHKVPAAFPFIIDNDFGAMKSTKDVIVALHKLGFTEELQRAQASNRAGHGKMRGRKTTVPRTILFVVAQTSPLVFAARNIPGVEVVSAKDMNAKHLAPGCHAGRLTLYTKGALPIIAQRFSGAGVASPPSPSSSSSSSVPAPAGRPTAQGEGKKKATSKKQQAKK